MAAGEFPEPVALDFTAAVGASPARVPLRIKRRLMEAKTAPASAEEIEARLREAGARRQQFHEWLSCKAKGKPRSPSWSSQEDDLGHRLEAKLIAAEQKRLSLLENAQRRLAKLDEIRQAAKTVVEMRNEKEREELCSRVQSRARHAEENRLRLLNARMQRRAALKERKARSLVQRATKENKYKELVRSAISHKRAAAENKRLGLLEAGKRRAQARVLQAQSIAKAVCKQREVERRKMKEQLEDRLQRAKHQRAEFLKQRGNCSSSKVNFDKSGDFLSRKLARCWRRFVKSRKTTYALAHAFQVLGINESSAKSMPFERFALCIEAPNTLQTAKALLDRLETRLLLSQLSSSTSPENIDHLLKHLATPRKRGATKRASRAASSVKRASRYSLRVVLCAYMILGHPVCVLSGKGDKEKQLMDSASKFITEFEMLLNIICNQPFANTAVSSCADEKTFRKQLVNFDQAWCSYLYHFVAWKAKDAKSLEEDLVRAACQLELSMIQTCKLSIEGQTCSLTHDMKAIQKQVIEDQRLIQEKVHHLSGDAGILRLKSALSDARLEYFERKGNGSLSSTPIAHIASPGSSSGKSETTVSEGHPATMTSKKNSNVARSLFGSSSEIPSNVDIQSTTDSGKAESVDQLLLDINEVLHEADGTVDDLGAAPLKNIMVSVKSTIEKAFWDGVLESIQGGKPDFSRILDLVKEVRDELLKLAPKKMMEITNSIDIDILSQVLGAGFQDTQYLGQILEYSLSLVRQLSAAAYEDEMEVAHRKMLSDLASISQSDEKSFVVAVVKGLRYVLEEIQKLKDEVMKATIMLRFKGPEGLKYLQKAFTDRYGPPSNASAALPLTMQWISSVKSNMDAELNEYSNSLSALPTNAGQQHTLVGTLRTGISVGKQRLEVSAGAAAWPECSGEMVDKLLRIGMLELVSDVEGTALQALPETLALNEARLVSLNIRYRQVILIATSMLVLRQTLISEKAASNLAELDGLMSDFVQKTDGLMNAAAGRGVETLINTMLSSFGSNGPATANAAEVMTRMLEKSLQRGDAVFRKTCAAVHSALRGVVLGGSGAKGQRLAEAALRRIGAGALADRVLRIGEAAVRMATVSASVHGPWYRSLTQ